MKKLIACLVAIAVSANAQPAAPITATFSAQNIVDQIDIGRQVYNVDLCKRLGVTGTCNQN